MSPQNWLCRSERNSALDTQAPNSPLVHINGDNAYSPPNTRRETHGDNSYICDMSFVKNAKVQSLTPDNTRCLLNISWRHFVSNTNKPKPHESCSTSKANHIPRCNKNLFIKTPFDLRHLTPSSSPFQFPTNLVRGLTTLSEETTQRKHTYVTTIPCLPTTKTLATKMVSPR